MERRTPKLTAFILAAFSFLFGGSSYDILHLSKDARSLSLHNAASAYDHSLLRNNPAALSLSTGNISYSSIILPAGIHSGEVQWICKRNSDIHAGKLSYIGYGPIIDGETTEKTTAYEILLEMGYKNEFKNIISLGISGGYLLSSISGYHSQLLYTNIGIRSRMKGMGLGFSLENLGFLLSSYTDVKESVPAIFRTALYYIPKYLPTIISADIIRRLDRDAIEFSGGLEFQPKRQLTLRLGCSNHRIGFLTGDFSSDLLVDISGGAGFQFNNINLDVGFMNLGAAGYVVGFSISKK